MHTITKLFLVRLSGRPKNDYYVGAPDFKTAIEIAEAAFSYEVESIRCVDDYLAIHSIK